MDTSGLADVKVVLRVPEVDDTQLQTACKAGRVLFDVPTPKVYCVVEIWPAE